MPKISVIVPVYNAEKYLVQCLDSLRLQEFGDFEVICINDGSFDNSGKILTEFAELDKRFIIINKKNAGVSAARNDGIKIARGEYIHFMDADDVIDSEYYSKMIHFAEGNDVICSGFISNSKYSSSLTYKRKHVLVGIFGKLLWSQALVKSFVWRYLFKTEFIKKNKLLFDTSLVSQEDAIFVLDSLVKANRLVIVPNVNYHYIFNENSALNSKGEAHRAKLKKQYKFGKQYRKQYAKNNNVMLLWWFRKLLKLFF
ncbi:MAG: glycosyltransferase [Alphaproteobacteria bacterium]|nr:glycosyltransferase [Alphaproteobacteria bacterium]